MSRLLPLVYEVRGEFKSVMCSLITDKVSLMTGESEVMVNDRVPAAALTGREERMAVAATGGCAPTAVAGRDWWAVVVVEALRCIVGDDVLVMGVVVGDVVADAAMLAAAV